MVIESTRSTLNNFFKADLLANTTHLHDGVILLLRPESVSFKDGSGCLLSKCRASVQTRPPQPTQFALILSPLPSQILCSQVSRNSAIQVFLVYIFLNFVIPASSKAFIFVRESKTLKVLVVK